MDKCSSKTKRRLLKKIGKWLYPFYLSIIQPLRSHPWLIRCLFRVRLMKGEKVSWDFTTLALKCALKKRLAHHDDLKLRVLEIGVGKAALLSLYLARKYGLKPDGVDIVADRVIRSNQVARNNSIPLHIWQSDFFQAVEGTYDLVFWNAAYIPTEFGEYHHLTYRDDLGDKRAWDGGNDGTYAIKRFLEQAPRFLNSGGEILLGVNSFYVPQEAMHHILHETPLVQIGRISSLFNPSTVYVLRNQDKK